jgi:hypothetical protein
LLAAAASAARAQGDLNETQLLGRQVFAQVVRHLPPAPSLGVKTYGPMLNKASAAGNDEVMCAFIVNGSEPAFNYYLNRAEIDAIIAYLGTCSYAKPRKETHDEHDSDHAPRRDDLSSRRPRPTPPISL